jgi:hypothetical protein
VQAEGEPLPDGMETTDVRLFAEDALPPLAPGHDLRVPVVYRMLRGELPVPYYDDPERPFADRHHAFPQEVP